jgi:hypothetical protein
MQILFLAITNYWLLFLNLSVQQIYFIVCLAFFEMLKQKQLHLLISNFFPKLFKLFYKWFFIYIYSLYGTCYKDFKIYFEFF